MVFCSEAEVVREELGGLGLGSERSKSFKFTVAPQLTYSSSVHRLHSAFTRGVLQERTEDVDMEQFRRRERKGRAEPASSYSSFPFFRIFRAGPHI